MAQPTIEELDFTESNPVLSLEEIESFRAFFKLFENEFGMASVTKITASLEHLSELNTGVIRKILTWAADKNNSNC